MKIYFSTVARYASNDKSGEIVLLDWDTKRIEARASLFPSDPSAFDPNPRGGSRGGRGIALWRDGVIVATYASLRLYDRDLTFQREISHPLMAGLHEVYHPGGDTLWVSATAIDLALAVDLEGGQAVRDVWPRNVPAFQEPLGVTPSEIDPSADNRGHEHTLRHKTDRSHLHLNALGEWNGDLYGLFNRYAVIANLDRPDIVVRDLGDQTDGDRGLRGSHNLLIEQDGTVTVAGTFGRNVRVYDLAERRRKRVIKLTDFPWVARLARRYDRVYRVRKSLHARAGVGSSPSRPLFVRGLDKVGDLLFVGVSPAAILAIDVVRGTLEDVFQYSKSVDVCVHGLRAVADGNGAASA